MPSYSHVTIVGHVGRDPELRELGVEKCVCNFSIAVNESWKTASGEKQERVSWFDCEAWGKQAQAIARYVHKGDPLLVDGTLRQDKWEDDTGAKKSRVKIVVGGFTFLKGKGDDTGEAAPESKPAAQGKVNLKAAGLTQDATVTDDDIPF